MKRTVFITGATGFIGRHVVSQALLDKGLRLLCLTRQGRDSSALPPSIERISGDLREPSTYASHLVNADIVVHLAAVTGKARPEDYVAVNVEGTRALVGACREAGVRRFVLVSSIAASYPDNTHYPYGRSKAAAERVVVESGLNFLIVRPTLVFGEDSPISHSLAGLAQLPITPIFGSGRVRVQPVYVDDVAAFLVWAMKQVVLPNRRVDLGGPDVTTFAELTRSIRRSQGGSESFVVRAPVQPFIATLSWIERHVFAGLPVSAGQFSAFINDSVAAPDPIVAVAVPRMMSLDRMLASLAPHD